MKKISFNLVMVGVLALFSAVAPVQAQQPDDQVLFGITFFQNQIITIDPATGQGTLVAAIGEEESGYGLAAYQDKLYTFNPNTGTVDQISVINGRVVERLATGIAGAEGEGAIAINPDTGLGFIASAFPLTTGGPSGTHPLYTFNVTTGAPAVKLADTTIVLDGLAFDSDGTLYAVGQGDVEGGDPNQGEATLYTVNQLTGATTAVGPLGVPQNSPVAGLTFAPDGTLHGAIDDKLYSINKSTGAATRVDTSVPDFGFNSVSGIAYSQGGGVLANISTRATVRTGHDLLIIGFMVRPRSSPAPEDNGAATTEVILRAIGPSLAVRGVPVAGRLNDPSITLHDENGTQIAFNDNWMDNPAPQRTRIQDVGLAPENARESALDVNLPEGDYTAIVRGVNNSMGIALGEFYDVEPGDVLRQTNLSSRAFVGTGDDVAIAGLIIQGSVPRRIILRGLGPSLANSTPPVPTPLADPILQLFDANGNLIETNDNWEDSPREANIIAAGLDPDFDSESVIDRILDRGPYTAVLRGAGGTTGNALVEVYDFE